MTSRHSSPLHIPAVDREPAFSLMSRMAFIGGISALEFGSDIGVSFRKILDGDRESIERLARIAGMAPEPLLNWTLRRSSRSRRLLRNELFPSKTALSSIVRGCPMCLQEDAIGNASSPHSMMAIRGDWLVPHVMICVAHEQALVPLWQESRVIDRYETVTRFSEIAPKILRDDHTDGIRDTADYDLWMDGRLVNGVDETWLSKFKLNASANFCRLIGSALMKLEGIPLSAIDTDSQWGLYQMGFEVAKRGEAAIHEALQELNRLAEPHQGPKAVFPLLYDRLSRDYRDDTDYLPFKNILASHLLETWPLGPGDDLLGRHVTERRLHSVRTASLEFGVDTRRLRKLLKAAGIIDGRLPDAWSVFKSSDADQILARMERLVTAKEFAEGIDLSRSQFDLLIADNILSPALKDAKTKHVWDPRDGRTFLDRLLSGAETLRQGQRGWEPIAKTSKRLKIRPAEIIRSIWGGRIQRVGNNVQFTGYRAVHVFHAEVAMVLGPADATEMSLEIFAKNVGIRQPVFLSRLVMNGHTSATELLNHRTKVRQRYITSQDADAFHAKFVTLRTLSEAQGTSWQKMSRMLQVEKVTPFSPDGQDYGNLYLKSEAESVFR